MRLRLVILALAALVAYALRGADAQTATEGIVKVGAGSYTTVLPANAKEPPLKPFVTSRVHQPVPTNDWWSSLAWQTFSNQMFPYPLGLQAQATGLRMYYPGTGYTSNPEGVFTAIMQSPSDVVIGLSTVKQFPDARVDAWSDWFVTSVFAEQDRKLNLTFGHGSPFIYGSAQGGNPSFTFASPVKPVPLADYPGAISVEVNNRTYGLYAPAGADWKGGGSTTLTAQSSKPYFSVALLPDNKPTTLRQFAAVAHNHVVDSKAAWSYNEESSTVTTSYTFVTKSYEGKGVGTIYGLLPHQVMRSSAPLTGQTYLTARGTLKLAQGTGFTTVTPYHGVLPVIPRVDIPSPDILKRFVDTESTAFNPELVDTYWTGKSLGKLSTLSAIADITGNSTAKATTLGRLKALLENYFTAVGDVKGLFYYNKPWGTLIGMPASFGSDEALNDHHFHYGYFIRAAAEVARQDPAWASPNQWGGMVELLIRDCANPYRSDTMFPYLRNFDIYEGHTWADGKGDFADGNNNESSSEAMNAWTGLILWGELTGNKTLRDTGIYLYVTEKDAIDHYWFGIYGGFPKEFTRQYASMIWGGKAVYATWFSGDPIHMHGINLLPLQSGSLYLSTHSSTIKPFVDVLNRERIVYDKKDAKRDQSLPERTGARLGGWADVIQMYQVLADPEGALAVADFEHQEIEAGNSRANYYQWMHTMAVLGKVDTAVFANTAMYTVFSRPGQKTYVVYNGGLTPRRVTFTDGTVVIAKAKAVTTLQKKAGK